MSRRDLMLLAPVLLLAGCGNSRTPVPSSQAPNGTGGLKMLRYPAAGISLRAPGDWTTASGRMPLVATITSGAAVVAVWRYRRPSGPPTGAALARARRVLIAAAKAHDRHLVLIRSTITRVDGAPAIELDAFEQISGLERRVRSTHVYERRAEVVLDEFAPPDTFHSVDHRVFSPLRRSLTLFRATAA